MFQKFYGLALAEGADVLDTYTGSVYGFKLNLHYWSDTNNTLGRMPDFAILDTPISV